METIADLETRYKVLQRNMLELSDSIIEHLHMEFDSKLNNYTSFDNFLEDINNYTGDTFGKLMYINYAKNQFDINKRIK